MRLLAVERPERLVDLARPGQRHQRQGHVHEPLAVAEALGQAPHRDDVLRERVGAADHGPHRRAVDDVDRHLALRERLEQAYVSVAPGAAARQRQADGAPGEPPRQPVQVPRLAQAHVVVGARPQRVEPAVRAAGQPGAVRVDERQLPGEVGARPQGLEAGGVRLGGGVGDEQGHVHEPQAALGPWRRALVGQQHDVLVRPELLVEPHREGLRQRVVARHLRHARAAEPVVDGAAREHQRPAPTAQALGHRRRERVHRRPLGGADERDPGADGAVDPGAHDAVEQVGGEARHEERVRPDDLRRQGHHVGLAGGEDVVAAHAVSHHGRLADHGAAPGHAHALAGSLPDLQAAGDDEVDLGRRLAAAVQRLAPHQAAPPRERLPLGDLGVGAGPEPVGEQRRELRPLEPRPRDLVDRRQERGVGRREALELGPGQAPHLGAPAPGGDVGAALRHRDQGHLADDGAGLQPVYDGTPHLDGQLAGGEQAHELADLAAAHQMLARCELDRREALGQGVEVSA